jgi:hypothetical protein
MSLEDFATPDKTVEISLRKKPTQEDGLHPNEPENTDIFTYYRITRNISKNSKINYYSSHSHTPKRNPYELAKETATRTTKIVQPSP